MDNKFNSKIKTGSTRNKFKSTSTLKSNIKTSTGNFNKDNNYVGEFDTTKTTDDGYDALCLAVFPSVKKLSKDYVKNTFELGVKDIKSLVSNNKVAVKSRLAKKIRTKNNIKGKSKLHTHYSNKASTINSNNSLKTGRSFNRFAKRSLKGNMSYSSFYKCKSSIDKTNTNNTGTESIREVRRIRTNAKNTKVLAKNTYITGKKTYTKGKRLYTKIRRSVFKKPDKVIKPKKSNIIKKTFSNSRAFIQNIRSLKDKITKAIGLFLCKIGIIIIAVLVFLNLMNGAIVAIGNTANGLLGWLYNDDDDNTIRTIQRFKNNIYTIATEIEKDINNKASTEDFQHCPSSERKIFKGNYIDMLTVLGITKAKYNNTGEEIKGMDWIDKNSFSFTLFEIDNFLSFYFEQEQYTRDYMYDVWVPDPEGNEYDPYKDEQGYWETREGEKEAIFLKNKTTNEVMNELDFSDEEKEIAKLISYYVADFLTDHLPNNIKVDTNEHGFAWPTPDLFNITSEYGMRRDPFTNDYKLHNGIDISGSDAEASPVIAAINGKVTKIGFGGRLGHFIHVSSSNDEGEIIYICEYAHLLNVFVEEGDEVEVGDVIGAVGSTGKSTGDHLHFSIKFWGEFLTPIPSGAGGVTWEYTTFDGDYINPRFILPNVAAEGDD